MRTIFARIFVRYSGRIDAELELGDYLLVRKDCGAVKIEGASGLKEKNWMPSGSSWHEEQGLIVCEFSPRSERLEVYIEQIYSDTNHAARMGGKLVKLGSEREFSDLLVSHLDLVEPGLEIVSREAATPAGPIDLLCRDASGCPVVIEVKRNKGIGSSTPYQLLRYLAALTKLPAWQLQTPRGILVAPGLARGTKELLAELGLGYVRLAFEDVQERVPARGEDGAPRRPIAALVSEQRVLILEQASRRGCRNVRLAGAAARGADDFQSELELLVDLDEGETIFALAGLAEELTTLLGVEVDVKTAELLEPEARTAALAAARPL